MLYRLGLRLPPAAEPSARPIWVHALSVGEVLSALPLIRGLKRRRPDRPVVLSASTLTGFELARRRAADRVEGLYYFPYDLPFSIRRVTTAVRPNMVILTETDLWPNFLRKMEKSEIPVVLVNARLSESTLRGYRKIRPLVRPMLRSLRRICAQTPEEADRFASLGVDRERLSVTGNLKFDQEVDPQPVADPKETLRAEAGISEAGPVLVAGSTHPGEEEILARVFTRLTPAVPGLQMVVAPRDPNRAPAVCRLLTAAGIAAARLKEGPWERAGSPQATVVDRIGLLRSLYALADVAFVGGSLVSCGGHNPLEPAAWGRPVVFGPDMSDFSSIAAELLDAGGAVRVKDGASLFDVLRGYVRHPETARAAGGRAYGVFAAHRGAVDRTLAVLPSEESGLEAKR